MLVDSCSHSVESGRVGRQLYSLVWSQGSDRMSESEFSLL